MRPETERWWKQAASEIEDLIALYKMHRWAKACLCAQQAAEMAVKALHIEATGRAHPKSHDLEKIAKPLGRPPALETGLNTLTRFYFEVRYPDVPNTLACNSDTAKQAVDLLRPVLDWVAQRLGTIPHTIQLG